MEAVQALKVAFVLQRLFGCFLKATYGLGDVLLFELIWV